MREQRVCDPLLASSGSPKITNKPHASIPISPDLREVHRTNSFELYQDDPVENERSKCTSSRGTKRICDMSCNPSVCLNIHHTAGEEALFNDQNSRSATPRDAFGETYVEARDRRDIKGIKATVGGSPRNTKSSQHSSDLLGSSNSMFRRYSSSSSSSCDSMCQRTYNANPQSIFSSSSDENGEDSMFIPEPIIQLSSRVKKPVMPYHTIEQLPPGKPVWVVDEEDVEMFLPAAWCNAYKLVCNGRLGGRVVRHSGRMTIVRFHDDASDMSLSLTLPRSCLSIKNIEPYENSQSVEKGVFSSCCCKTRQRMACSDSMSLENSHSKTHHQFYECLSVLRVPTERLEDLGEAQECFQREDFATALELVNRQLSARTPGMPPDVDALTLRSQILIFLGRYEDALVDAVCCAEVEPRWVRGYLCMARAHSGLGNFNEAAAALRKASVLLPNSAELERIKDLNSYMIKVQKLMQKVSNGKVLITLDSMYCKRMIVQSQSISQNRLLCWENTPILAMPSLFGNRFSGRCEVCFRDGGEEMDDASVNTFTSVQTNYTSSPVSELKFENDAAATNHGDSFEALPATTSKPTGLYCSEYCQKRSTLFSRLEEKHKEGLQHVREMIYAKAPNLKDMSSLEMMNMTTRLFFMVVSTHRRLISYHLNLCKHTSSDADGSNLQKSKELLQSQGISKVSPIFLETFTDKAQAGIENFVSNANVDSDVESRGATRGPTTKVMPIEIALKVLGVYPLVNDYLSTSQRAELITLYKALTVKFKEESKKIYTEVLFYSLYNYIKCYFTPIYVSPTSAVVSPTMIQVFGKDGDNTTMPFCISNTYYVYYLPLLLSCAVREEDLASKRDGLVHLRCPSFPLRSPESSSGANSKIRFVDWRRSLFHSPRAGPKCGAVSSNLVSLASSVSGEEGADGTWDQPFPLLEAIALRPIRCRESLIYSSMPHIGGIH
ncbi:unnamed protein product [Phytomonas sp. EM1]|nr:unnamed protein product [Phytomonas sp. EM1]|eukprot:CCW61592.1 unnamed protein product [Phytomonas sp. isolate EM1]